MAERKNLLDPLLEQLDDEDQAISRALHDYLAALGYAPRKARVQGYVLDYVHPSVGRAILKLGVRKAGERLSLSLRFSACEAYSAKFDEAIGRMARANRYVTEACCGLCGEHGRLYSYRMDDGREVRCCGAYAFPVEGIGKGDIPELQRLIGEQHGFWMQGA